MRPVTRTVTVVAVSTLALAGSIGGADARSVRSRSRVHTVPHASRTATVESVPTIAAVGTIGVFDPSRHDTNLVTRSVTTAGSPGADEAAPIPPMPPAPVAARKPAEAWCRSGRIAGTGEGFCLIN